MKQWLKKQEANLMKKKIESLQRGTFLKGRAVKARHVEKLISDIKVL